MSLQPLPDGLYLLQAVQGQMEAQAILQVSNLNVQVKQSSQQILTRVIDRDRHPVAGATVRYKGRTGGWVTVADTSDTSGTVLSNVPAGADGKGALDGKLFVAVDAGTSGSAIIDTDFFTDRY